MSALRSFQLHERNRRGLVAIELGSATYPGQPGPEKALRIWFNRQFAPVMVYFRMGAVEINIPPAQMNLSTIDLVNRFFALADLPYLIIRRGRGRFRRYTIRNRSNNASQDFTGQKRFGLSGRQYRIMLQKVCPDGMDAINLLDMPWN